MKPTTQIVLETRWERKDEKYPVKLRVTFQRKAYYFATGYVLTEDEFKETQKQRLRSDFKEIAYELREIEAEAREILKGLHPFDPAKFRKRFKTYISGVDESTDLLAMLEERIEDLEKNGRPATAETYRNTQSSIKAYLRARNKKTLSLSDLSPSFLKKYQSWMEERGRSSTTIGVYLRNLRHVFNRSIQEGLVSRSLYPFGPSERGLYEIPHARARKLALSKDEVLKIINHRSPVGSPEAFYKDIWVFSYLCNGANPGDIFRLKYSNVEKDTIFFEREKTKGRKNPGVIQAFNSEITQGIIDRWGSKPVEPDKYIFSILHPGMAKKEEWERKKQAVKMLNLYINRVAAAVGIDHRVTSYTARHSYSQVLKESGTSIAYISESLGHADLKTTQAYLKSFDKKHRERAAQNLL